MLITTAQLENLYMLACELDVLAFKPGNVSVYAEGHDMTVADFRFSAKVSAAPLCCSQYSLGEKIYYAVKATREAVACNTNLGIILLSAPLIQAVSLVSSKLNLRAALQQVLTTTTVADAEWVFKAIKLASPGGLGKVQAADVNFPASVTLTESMKLASDRDFIALQYISDYKLIYECSVLTYNHAFLRWGHQNWAVVAVYVDLLCQFPDSHIERKYGDAFSKMVAANMVLIAKELANTENPEYVLPLLYRIDQDFKSKGVNPGTTADLAVATVLTVFLEDLIATAYKSNNEFVLNK